MAVKAHAMLTPADAATGIVLTSATVNVYSPGTITPIGATMFDKNGGTLSNPLTSDPTTGLVDFYLTVAQEVDLVISKAGYTTRTLSNVPVIDDASFELSAVLTTTGDVVYASAASTPARLPIGTTGQFLTVSGGIPQWSNTIASGGLTITAGGMTLTAGFVTLPGGTPAGAGDLRLNNAHSINWRNAGNNNDHSIDFNSSDQFEILITGTQQAVLGAGFFKPAPGTAAAGGAVRLVNAGVIGWRNVGNTGDDSLTFDASDRLALVGTGQASSASVGANGAVPAQVLGYIPITYNGTACKIATFNT